jgi:uncharacterized membrane protein YhfC
MVSLFLFLAIVLVVVSSIAMFLRKHERISWKPIFIGVAVWFVFTQILEAGLHFLVFTTTQIQANPWAFAAYGAIAAGVFEEVGRYIGYRVFLKKYREWKDGVAYGFGHGAIEMLFISGMTVIQYLVATSMLSGGQVIPPPVIELLNTINATPHIIFTLSLFERIMVLPIHILFSLIVLHAIRSKKIIFLFYAIALHALVDVAPVLYQAKVIPLWIPMIVVAVWGIIATVYIVRSKRRFV